MKRLVSDELWELVEPLLPPEPDKPKGGRPRVPARSVLEGIVYVLKSGIPWSMLPKELGCSGVTCWRRLRDWQKTGVCLENSVGCWLSSGGSSLLPIHGAARA